MHFNSFWLPLHYFHRVDLKRGWAASWISYSLLSVFIYNSTYLQTTGETSAPTLAPNLRSDVFAIYHLIFNAGFQFSFKTEELFTDELLLMTTKQHPIAWKYAAIPGGKQKCGKQTSNAAANIAKIKKKRKKSWHCRCNIKVAAPASSKL